MKRLIPAIVVIAVLLIAVGLYRGWFVVTGSAGDQGVDKMNVNVSVDKDKLHDDVEAVKAKAGEVTGQ